MDNILHNLHNAISHATLCICEQLKAKNTNITKLINHQKLDKLNCGTSDAKFVRIIEVHFTVFFFHHF